MLQAIIFFFFSILLTLQEKLGNVIIFQLGSFVAFLAYSVIMALNSYGTQEFPDCGNLVGAD